MAPRNGVKKRIFGEFWFWISNTPLKRHGRVHGGRSPAASMVSSGATSSSLRERSLITGTAADAPTVVFAGADSLLLPERSVTTGTSVGVRRTRSPMTPTERVVLKSTDVLSPSLAAGVDKSLDARPALTRSNPTASILVKVPSADSLKYDGSRLYKDERGDWVVDLVPEIIAESDASSRTQRIGDRID